jgi:hypothetical protein
MPALFPRWSNVAFRVALLFGALVLLGVPSFLMGWVRTPAVTEQYSSPVQPVPFDHAMHAGALGIDCRYCHSTVERSASAGIPATSVCVPCHNQVWFQSPVFAPVRRSLATNQPIAWQRVNKLPDFVFFNHAIHVNKGVGCESCHGRVDEMHRIQQAAPLTMGWCLDCHRDPAPHLRPVEQMTAMGWTPIEPQNVLGADLMKRYHVQRFTNCTACHR